MYFADFQAPSRTKQSRHLKPRNTAEFWQMANEAAERSLTSSYLDHTELFGALQERFAFMNRRYIYRLCEGLHNRNKIKETLRPELGIASLLYEWRALNRYANPDKKSFQDWYEGTFTVYSGVPYCRHPEDHEALREVALGKFRSSSISAAIAIDFTQPRRARGAWMETALKDGWLLEADISPKQVHLFNNVMDEYECVLRGGVEFQRRTRIVAGQRA